MCSLPGSLNSLLLFRFFSLVGLPITSRYQVAQTVVDVEPPRARTGVVAFVRRNQPGVSEAEFGLVLLAVDLKDDVSAVPLGPVFHEVDVAVHDMPHDWPTLRQMLPYYIGEKVGW